MLQSYIADTQNLLNDSSGQFYRPETLTSYINRARRRIAMAAGCVRIMPPGTQTVPGQEEYKFRDWMALVQTVPGVKEIFSIRTVAIALSPAPGGWKPVWNHVISFSDFQARFRIYNQTWIGTISYPGYWSQYQFGTLGSIFLAPIPSSVQPMEIDCQCIPFPLESDSDPECIPMPWQDTIPYFATFLCMLQQQRLQDATGIQKLFEAEMPWAASVVVPQAIASPYGAAMRSV